MGAFLAGSGPITGFFAFFGIAERVNRRSGALDASLAYALRF
jgi:hypothetical protein